MKPGIYTDGTNQRYVVLGTTDEGVTLYIPLSVWVAGIRLAITVIAWLIKRKLSTTTATDFTFLKEVEPCTSTEMTLLE